jgi:hypothetical protein
MLRRRFVAAVALAMLAAALPTLVQAQAQRRVVYASALDQNGAPVDGLNESHFVVREDKVVREVVKVEPAADPMQIALLVDNSRAAEPYIRDFREALPAFITTIGADPTGTHHQVAVITIGERPTINTDYTLDLERAIKGAQRIFSAPDSGAYLLDAILETSKGIKKRESTRPVIVAVITAGPDLSNRFHEQVVDALHDAHAAFHVLVVGRPVTGDQDRLFVLDRGTNIGGGRYDNVLTGTGLTPRMKQLALELTHQYKITYARPETLLQPEQVTVSAAKPGITVRGFAPPQSTSERRE